MNKTLIRYSVILGSLLICVFLINSIWPITDQNIYLSNFLFFGVIGFTLISYYRQPTGLVSYFDLVKRSLLIAFLGGIIVSLFFIVYVNFIHQSYFEEIASLEVEKMNRHGMDQNSTRRTLRIIGVARKYHIKELSLIFSTLIRTLALSLIFGPIFINQKKII